MDCDPASLLAAAKCFKCMDAEQADAVNTYLTCQYEEGGVVPAGNFVLDTEDRGILDAGGNSILMTT